MTLKITYLPIKGAAELSRYILAYGGIPFTDEAVSMENWRAKEDTVLGLMPELTLADGQKFAQAVAIARYLARQQNLTGTSLEEQLLCDMVVETCRVEMVNEIRKHRGVDDETKRAQVKAECEKIVANLFEKLEKQYKGSHTVAESGLTWADFCLFNMATDLSSQLDFQLPKDLPKFNAICDHVGKLPAIKKYVENRPETQF